MPTEPDPPTLAAVVSRAISACELGAVDPRLDDLLERFEDADEPVRAVEDVGARVGGAVAELDPASEEPALAMAAATAVYLSFRPDELDAPPERLLRLAARAEFGGEPPAEVLDWLHAAGVEP